MRRDRLKINKAVGLREIKQDLRSMLREHRTLALKEMQRVAEEVYDGAIARVPVETGKLQASSLVTVSTVPRYPGIIATAEAHNERTNYDYAFIQEVNDDYNHPSGGQAHYLEEPFRKAVKEFYERMGWK